MIRSTLAVLIATVGSLAAQTPQVPRFDQFKVDTAFQGPVAPVVLTHNSEARRFRTVLRAGAAHGPNFAGAFTVVTWGCGSNCIVVAVVNAITGAVYIWPQAAGYGVDYHRDSRLLVVDRWDGCQPAGSVAPDSAVFLRWTGKRLVPVRVFANEDICQP